MYTRRGSYKKYYNKIAMAAADSDVEEVEDRLVRPRLDPRTEYSIPADIYDVDGEDAAVWKLAMELASHGWQPGPQKLAGRTKPEIERAI